MGGCSVFLLMSECRVTHAKSKGEMRFGQLKNMRPGLSTHTHTHLQPSYTSSSSGFTRIAEGLLAHTATHIDVGCTGACCILIPAPVCFTSSTVNAGYPKYTRSCRQQHQKEFTGMNFWLVLTCFAAQIWSCIA